MNLKEMTKIELISEIESLKSKTDKLEHSQYSRERYNLLMTTTDDGLYDWDLDSNELYLSPRWKEMLGYKDDELKNDFSTWEKLSDPDGIKRALEY